MHDTTVKMKDGRVFVGPIYMFRPEDGYLSLILDPEHYDYEVPDRLYFRDMESATTKNQRVTISKITTVDEIERARRQGWGGS